MEMRKLLIAETTEEFRDALVNHLKGAYQIRTCSEGKETRNLIRSYHPDVLVLDMMLPGLDGISILQAAAAAERRPAVLAIIKFCSDYMLEALTHLGVGYVMMKPCDVKATVNRIMDLSQPLKTPVSAYPDPHTVTSDLLLDLGMPTNLKGYKNLREAIPLMAKDPGQSLTKELYPAVGKLCDSSAKQVERDIRNAISSAWQQRDEQVWRRYFHPGKDGGIPKPTNGAFISRLADCLMAEDGLP